jgi:hypothetical protein
VRAGETVRPVGLAGRPRRREQRAQAVRGEQEQRDERRRDQALHGEAGDERGLGEHLRDVEPRVQPRDDLERREQRRLADDDVAAEGCRRDAAGPPVGPRDGGTDERGDHDAAEEQQRPRGTAFAELPDLGALPYAGEQPLLVERVREQAAPEHQPGREHTEAAPASGPEPGGGYW